MARDWNSVAALCKHDAAEWSLCDDANSHDAHSSEAVQHLLETVGYRKAAKLRDCSQGGEW